MEQTITALKVQRRNPNRINVYLDGEFAFGLSRLVAAWLSVGQKLSDEKRASLLHQDTVEVAYLRALNLLSYRARSQAEIEKRLIDKGFTSEDVEVVLERLVQYGFVNDQRFAADWVENRSTFRPRGRRLLTMELRQKGIDEEQIDAALQTVSEESDLAYQAAVKYMRKISDADWLKFRQKLGGFLGRRGFSYQVIAEITRKVWEEQQSTITES
ncbi:MAG: regulatory protein RecX [Anaerolineaceae bacterium]|nr:regulatory protein RecX [Anaerolineaceae bacterium]